ncbi:ankyrin repeat domain-containing protein [Paenibacillus melissococcoides]|uniref:ankyrin repeat domain-containing protein n=1 Tax=Paenibacillus TaxID=44249 RepID=UPI001BCE2EDF|nr:MULTISPECIES: ankyrin repeat domain-containing protein [Paenibacillus]MEB9895757.1 ankyrin repeat domain-containing protein [Bacillus cereus]CAH8706668.1 ankyrin repeat domain-containing protein [Paenibacillus melissococcoides]
MAQVLLEAGADPNDGESLYHAAESPEFECLDLLYRYGADVNATPALFRKLDGTPLHWAVVRGRSPFIVELLLKHGAPVNARRGDGKTAYMLAVRYGQRELTDTLERHGA